MEIIKKNKRVDKAVFVPEKLNHINGVDSAIINKIIMKMMVLLLIVDSINGFLIIKGFAFPIGQIYKLVMLFLIGVMLCKIPGVHAKMGITLIMLLIYLIYFLIIFPLFPVSDKMVLLSKFLFPFWGYFYFSHLLKGKFVRRYYLQIINVFKVNTIVFVVSIIAGPFGYGTSSYIEGLGYKGYFYALNEISGVGIVLLLFPLYLCYVLSKGNYIKYIALSIVFLCVAILIGSKLMLLSTVFGIVRIPRTSQIKQNVKSRSNAFTKLCLMLVAVAVGIAGYHLLKENGIINRWNYFYELGGIEQIIFSGRTEFWIDMKRSFFDSEWIVFLLGMGSQLTVEMDQFDILLNFGIIGCIAVYSFWIYLLWKAYTKSKTHQLARIVFLIDVLLFLASFVAGHIVFSGLLGPFLALLNALVLVPDKLFLRTYLHKKTC